MNEITGLNFCQNVTRKLWLMQAVMIGPLAILLHWLLMTFWKPHKPSTLSTSQNPSCPLPGTPLLVGLLQNTWTSGCRICSHISSKFRPVTEGTSLLLFASRDTVSVSVTIPWNRNKSEELPESPIQGKPSVLALLVVRQHVCSSPLIQAGSSWVCVKAAVWGDTNKTQLFECQSVTWTIKLSLHLSVPILHDRCLKPGSPCYTRDNFLQTINHKGLLFLSFLNKFFFLFGFMEKNLGLYKTSK